MNRYIILRFGDRRVLLLSQHGESATMTQHIEGHITFDYSSCDVIGMLTVKDGQTEPRPEDFVGLPPSRYLGFVENGERVTVDEDTTQRAVNNGMDVLLLK